MPQKDLMTSLSPAPWGSYLMDGVWRGSLSLPHLTGSSRMEIGSSRRTRIQRVQSASRSLPTSEMEFFGIAQVDTSLRPRRLTWGVLCSRRETCSSLGWLTPLGGHASFLV